MNKVYRFMKLQLKIIYWGRSEEGVLPVHWDWAAVKLGLALLD